MNQTKKLLKVGVGRETWLWDSRVPNAQRSLQVIWSPLAMLTVGNAGTERLSDLPQSTQPVSPT